MILTSWLKSAVLSGVNGLNDLLGGPQPFSRARIVDPTPSAAGLDDASRLAAIADSAELELAGFVSNGAFAQSEPNDMGDMGIWQGIYTAMTVLRWQKSKTIEAQTSMQAAAAAMACYFYKGQVVRGALPTALQGTLFHVDSTQAAQYFIDGEYTYREDASLDSMLGLMYGAAIVNRFGDDVSKASLSAPLSAFSAAFTKAGFNITNRDGSVTTYGACTPGFLQAPVRTLAAMLPSMVIRGNDWLELAKSFAPELATTDTQVPGNISYVNAHLAILANLTWLTAGHEGLVGYTEAVAGLRSLLGKYSDAGNAFLIYGCAAIGIAPTADQMAKAAKVLIEFPVGPKPQTSYNTSTAPSLQPVPVWQRPPVDVVWQRSPYTYSGSDSTSYNRMDFLLAYYLSLICTP